MLVAVGLSFFPVLAAAEAAASNLPLASVPKPATPVQGRPVNAAMVALKPSGAKPHAVAAPVQMGTGQSGPNAQGVPRPPSQK